MVAAVGWQTRFRYNRRNSLIIKILTSGQNGKGLSSSEDDGRKVNTLLYYLGEEAEVLSTSISDES
jgi:hypothetical protein